MKKSFAVSALQPLGITREAVLWDDFMQKITFKSFFKATAVIVLVSVVVCFSVVDYRNSKGEIAYTQFRILIIIS